MAFFEYKAKTKDGKNQTGSVEAVTKAEVVEILEDKQMIPLSISLKRKKIDFLSKLNFFNAVKVRDVAIFARQLSVMVSANLPIVQALKIMSNQTENETLRQAIEEIADEVEGGSQLSQAMRHFSNIFDDFFISMIRSGETSGKLDEILNYLAEQMEKDYDLMSKIKGAMIYPAFIVVGLIGVGIVMMVFVVPKLTGVLSELGGELPMATKILIGLSGFLVKTWWLLIVVVFIGVLLGKKYLKSEQGKYYSGWVKIKMPIFGALFTRIYIVRMTRSLSTLLVGGVPLPQALGITADVVSNPIYQDILRQTIQEVEDGHSVTSVFEQSGYMPAMITQMMEVGERTGKMDHILVKLTDFYTREIDNLVTNLVGMIEPIIMVVMGVAVGIMVAAIIMPMYNMASGF